VLLLVVLPLLPVRVLILLGLGGMFMLFASGIASWSTCFLLGLGGMLFACGICQLGYLVCGV